MTTTFDFGDGPVPARKRPRDDGWVADAARIDARVCGDARVYGDAPVCDNARVFDDARVFKQNRSKADDYDI